MFRAAVKDEVLVGLQFFRRIGAMMMIKTDDGGYGLGGEGLFGDGEWGRLVRFSASLHMQQKITCGLARRKVGAIKIFSWKPIRALLGGGECSVERSGSGVAIFDLKMSGELAVALEVSMTANFGAD